MCPDPESYNYATMENDDLLIASPAIGIIARILLHFDFYSFRRHPLHRSTHLRQPDAGSDSSSRVLGCHIRGGRVDRSCLHSLQPSSAARRMADRTLSDPGNYRRPWHGDDY